MEHAAFGEGVSLTAMFEEDQALKDNIAATIEHVEFAFYANQAYGNTLERFRRLLKVQGPIPTSSPSPANALRVALSILSTQRSPLSFLRGDIASDCWARYWWPPSFAVLSPAYTLTHSPSHPHANSHTHSHTRPHPHSLYTLAYTQAHTSSHA